jgi:hypothetical protein
VGFSHRLAVAVTITLLSLAPTSGFAAPTPSPSLATLLAVPPAGYEETPTALLHGQFTARDYADASYPQKANQVEETLRQFGFVDGYSKTWINSRDGRALIEVVLAFTGGHGARQWLSTTEAGDKTVPGYDHANTLSGISPSYGARVKVSSDVVGEYFSFVKGNDVFGVGVVSTKEDPLDLATSQAQAQYKVAPKETIPSAQWPENARTISAGLIATVVLAVGAIVIIALLVVFVIRRRRSHLAPAPQTSDVESATRWQDEGDNEDKHEPGPPAAAPPAG